MDGAEAWTPGSPSPRELLAAACREGDQRAWGELIKLYTPVVWSVARSFRLRAADCEDVCQLAWLRVVENIDRLREPAKFASWLVTITRREAIKHIERNRRHVPVGDYAPFDDRPDDTVSVEDAVIDRWQDPRTLEAFRGLEKHHQALLAMLMHEPAMSYDEISAALDMPRGSIGPTRNRILRRLRESVRPEPALAG
ncbi:RNA polymerase sigma factor [Sphaerisporangium siamense]|uniref:RNA polymerase sigma factor (Sigma-70 family) n=1 Tax=Sphaerisporangium siamense TaxID=795645 RepID=A0A7W7G9L1_9ACTN|nr:sigma-70 family RNA polymerase sigma factor [Sphaerisporangium siamense]MBB4699101.1 RNA polymerase sigma factor (sigma-70 family) [Sphaerisporangium siamense]GII86772.1 RNA polymerase sigma factor [Sphaerisporangium siamense]